MYAGPNDLAGRGMVRDRWPGIDEIILRLPSARRGTLGHLVSQSTDPRPPLVVNKKPVAEREKGMWRDHVDLADQEGLPGRRAHQGRRSSGRYKSRRAQGH